MQLKGRIPGDYCKGIYFIPTDDFRVLKSLISTHFVENLVGVTRTSYLWPRDRTPLIPPANDIHPCAEKAILSLRAIIIG